MLMRKQKLGSIYLGRCIIDGNGYVGLTMLANPEDRIEQHLMAKTNSKFHRAIREHGVENFLFFWIHYKEIPKKDIQNAEREYIKKFDTINNGYNRTEGGELGGRIKIKRKYVEQSDMYSAKHLEKMFRKEQYETALRTFRLKEDSGRLYYNYRGRNGVINRYEHIDDDEWPEDSEYYYSRYEEEDHTGITLKEDADELDHIIKLCE